MWSNADSSYDTTFRDSTSTATSVAAAVAIALASAIGTYYLDPRSGRRRRALLRDRTTRAVHQTRDLLDTAVADARNRARGLYSMTTSRLHAEQSDNQRLAERVRSKLGRVCSHPRAIRVAVNEGDVTLRGDILEHELAGVLRAVRHVPGVLDVTHELQVHQRAGRMPFLQGNAERGEPRMEYLQQNWSPAPRVLAGAAGAAMMASALGIKSWAGAGLALGGAALLARSISNVPLSHLFGVRGGIEDGIVIQKTMHVYAELDEVYSCWRQIENFPRFMSHVREVKKLSDTMYHWVVDGPAGIPVEWDSEITADVPGELIAWRTVPGSVVHSSGIVQFEPDAYGDTRVHIRMAYRPPANAVGRTVAKIFGADPRRQMDDDLARFKSYMEVGKTTGTYGTVTRH
jgi:uncharacterized membrane protein/osmotically-inducible protein OsmY